MSTIKYTPDLVTLNYVRTQRELASETSDDLILTEMIHAVSADMIRYINRVPMPYTDTKTYDYTRDYVWDGRTLYLDDDLLSVSSIVNDGATIAPTSYVLRPANQLPYDYVRLKSAEFWTYTDDIEDAITVSGTWGYVPHFATAWRDSGIDIPVGGLSSSATSIVASSSASFEVLQYIRVNDETMQITATNTNTNTLTVTRGELGTTAAAHDAGDAIEQFQQLADIKHDVNRIVSYLYKTLHNVGGELQVFAGVSVAVERLDPSIMRGIRNKYRRTRPYIA